MLTNYCYQTDIRFQSLNCPVPSPLLCGLDIGYSGIKIQSPCNASIIPSIVVKARNDSPLLINGEDIRYRDEKRADVVCRQSGQKDAAVWQHGH